MIGRSSHGTLYAGAFLRHPARQSSAEIFDPVGPARRSCDLFKPCSPEGLLTGRDVPDDGEGYPDRKEHPHHLSPDRCHDRTVAGGRDHSRHCLLFCRPDPAFNLSPDDFSAEQPGLGPDRHQLRHCGHHRCHLRHHRKDHGRKPHADRRRGAFRRLFSGTAVPRSPPACC